MMLAQLLREALERCRAKMADDLDLRRVLFLTDEMLKRYESNQDTLAAITDVYVKRSKELAELKFSLKSEPSVEK
jgi:hypothetical protein